MNLKLIFLGILAAAGVVLVSIYNHKTISTDPQIGEEYTITTREKVENQLNSMSLGEKIGQLLYITYDKGTVSDVFNETIRDIKPGGFILFENNIINKNQLNEFVDTLQDISDIPMFIGIDQEGGVVQRLRAKEDITATDIPSMYDIGRAYTTDKKLPYDMGDVMGKELRVFGINMDFAPVVDIYSNPANTVISTRAFSNTSDHVSEMALAVGQGLSDNGVIPVYKHFPGHGDTREDSHYVLPISNKSYDELSNLELVPYFDLIKNGVDVIMVGHIALPKITGDNIPASLNKKIVNDILRDKLGFQGLVITDGVNMGALANNYSTKEIACMAIDAGVDMILMPNTSAATYSGLLECLNDGELTIEQVDMAVTRILTLKYNKGLFDERATAST